MKRPGLILACVSALALSLTACTAPTPPPATSEQSSSTSASPEASAEAQAEAPAEAASIEVSVDGIAILGAGGETIAEFGYFDADAAPAIAALTEAFGAAPTESQSASTNHPESDSVNSEWSGFELRDLAAETLHPDYPNFTVRVTVPESNGISIRTTDGVHVGMPIAEVEPLSYRNWVDTGTGTEIPIFLLEQQPVETSTSPDYEPAALSVIVSSTSPGGVVTDIGAPAANFGA